MRHSQIGEACTKKPYTFRISTERVHEIKSNAGKVGGRLSHGGGRPKGSTKWGEPRKPVAMPQTAYDTFRICAAHDGKTRVQFLADYAASLRADPRYAHLFAEEAENNDNTNQQEEQK